MTKALIQRGNVGIMTDAKKKEFTLRITQANRSRLLVILYEMTLCYVSEAESTMISGGKADFHKSISNIRNCVNLLIGSLDLRYKPSMQLMELYIYINRELIRVDIHMDEERLKHIRTMISRLRDAYAEAAKADDSPSLVSNAQQVYAGLTYGKGDLKEEVVTEHTGCEYNA